MVESGVFFGESLWFRDTGLPGVHFFKAGFGMLMPCCIIAVRTEVEVIAISAFVSLIAVKELWILLVGDFFFF